jgi:hypothetical protein
MGGTFMSMPGDYRDYFIRNLHDALSGHSSSSVHEAVRYSEQVSRRDTHRVNMCQHAALTEVKDRSAVIAGCLNMTLAHSPVLLFAVTHQVHWADH